MQEPVNKEPLIFCENFSNVGRHFRQSHTTMSSFLVLQNLKQGVKHTNKTLLKQRALT